MMFGFFATANAALLIALLQGGQFPVNPWAGAIVATVGLLLAVVWRMLQGRAVGHTRRYDEVMLSLEIHLKISPEHSLSPELNNSACDRHLSGGLSARKTMNFCATFSALLWGVGLFVFLARGICEL